MKYIVVKCPSANMYYRWTMKDSLDGIVYSSFEEALTACQECEGCGVAELSED